MIEDAQAGLSQASTSRVAAKDALDRLKRERADARVRVSNSKTGYIPEIQRKFRNNPSRWAREAAEAELAEAQARIREDEILIRQLDMLEPDRNYMLSKWEFAKAEWDAVTTEWKKQAEARRQEEENPIDPQVRRLRNFAMTTVAGMFTCWVAQWVWWTGYIK